MNRFKKIIAVIIAVVICFAAVSCGNSENNDGKEKITVVLDWVPNTNHTGLYAAIELGYFAEAGIEVEIVSPPENGAELLVASNGAQFGISVQENVITAITASEPLPIKAVATIVNHNTSGIISLKDKGIKTPKDLEGKRYATWDAPIEKAMMKNIVEEDGGDFEKVVMVQSMVTDILSALQTDIDAVWIFQGWDGMALEVLGVETNYLDFKEINPVFDYYTPVIIANNDFLRDKPELAKKFLAAAEKGYEYAIDKPVEAVDILLKHAPEIDKNIALKSQEYLKKEYKAEAAVWGKFDEVRWMNFSNWLYEEGIINRKLNDGEGFTNEFLG